MSRISFFSTLPITPKERVYGPIAFTCITFSLFVATWCLLTGGAVADFVNASLALGVTFFAELTCFAFVGLSLMVCYWYGIDPYVASRPIFGVRGSFIVLTLSMIVGLGWIALIQAMFASGVTKLLVALNASWAEPKQKAIFLIAGLLFVLLVWLITWKGPIVVRWTNLIIAPVVLIVLVGMTILILKGQPWSVFATIPPNNPFGSFRQDNITAIELLLGGVWSWWPYAGVWMRYAKSPRVAFHGTVYGTGIGGALAIILAAFSALVVKEIDPTAWMIAIGGIGFGALALLWIAAANIMSGVGQLFPVCLAAQNWKFFNKMKWVVLVFIFCIPLILVAPVSADTLFSLTSGFLIFCGVFFCPASAIFMVDFWLLRKRKLNVREIYKDDKDGEYYYYKGFNPAAVISFALGFFTYIFFVNPVTLESSVQSIFNWTAASPPVVLITGISYYVLTKAWIMKKGWGGYSQQQTTEQSTTTEVSL